MHCEELTDSTPSSSCKHIAQWQTDLNSNGIAETWLAFFRAGLHIWEGLGEKQSALLFDANSTIVSEPEYWCLVGKK